MKRVFIVHGWDGHPDEGWFPWLKKELEDKGFEVFVPQLPVPDKFWINGDGEVNRNYIDIRMEVDLLK